MAKKMQVLLWHLREETAQEFSELRQSELDVWLDEQSALTAAYSRDLATMVQLLEQALSARGVSLRTH